VIYVTGAAGFIGTHLVDAIRKTDDGVACCDIRDTSMIHPSRLIEHMKNNNPSIVFHLGAISSTTETNTVSMTIHNILLSCAILEYCIENNIPMVYSSSASVYGLGKHGFGEDAQLTPLNYYAISKASFDAFALQKIKDNPAARVYGLRYFNVYGKNEDHKGAMASPIHKFLKQSREHGTIKVFEGSENFHRDFVHVDDVVSITLAVNKFTKSGIYNVGTGTPTSFMDVANIVSDITGAQIVEIPFPNALLKKYQEYTCSDNTKINDMGCHTDRIDIEKGIKRVLSI